MKYKFKVSVIHIEHIVFFINLTAMSGIPNPLVSHEGLQPGHRMAGDHVRTHPDLHELAAHGEPSPLPPTSGQSWKHWGTLYYVFKS